MRHEPVCWGVETSADIQPFDYHRTIEFRRIGGAHDDNPGTVGCRPRHACSPSPIRSQGLWRGIGICHSRNEIFVRCVAQLCNVICSRHQRRHAFDRCNFGRFRFGCIDCKRRRQQHSGYRTKKLQHPVRPNLRKFMSAKSLIYIRSNHFRCF